MSLIKYKANSVWTTITKVEVEKETDHFVWIDGRQHKKQTSYDNYYNSWEEARDFLYNRAAAKIKAAYNRLEYAQKEIDKVRKLVKSD